MNCQEARDLILQADLPALRGMDGSALATHVQSCAACRRASDRILEDTALLGDALDHHPVRLHRAGRVAVPVAIAAAAALVLLLSPRGGPPVDSAADAPPVMVGVTDRNAAVFETPNPNITVVWLF